MPKAAVKKVVKKAAKAVAKKPREFKKFGLKLVWKSHFDPERDRSAITWYKTEAERDAAIVAAEKDKRPDGSSRYTEVKKIEKA
jgi:hypothetical protein